jgi:branched-chain amino acid aminotransferase
MLNFNGSIFQDNDPVFNPQNRSFRYGEGLFETMRAVNGKVPLFGWHFDRLLRGMKALKINIPPHFNVHYLKNEVSKTLDKMPAARVRLAVWRESGGGYTPTNFNPEFLIESLLLPDNQFTINDLGLTMGVYSSFRLHQTPVSAFKTANALPYVLAGIYARENCFDDVFMLDTEGSFSETISSNFFILKDEKLWTPPLSTGCVGGVFRAFFLDFAKKKNIEIEEKKLLISDIETADEVFLTNALQGFRWVEKFNDSDYQNTFTFNLFDLFLNEIKSL